MDGTTTASDLASAVSRIRPSSVDAADADIVAQTEVTLGHDGDPGGRHEPDAPFAASAQDVGQGQHRG